MSEYDRNIICPQCRTHHGPAARSCECGFVFEKEEDAPAPAKHFFIASAVFAVGSMLAGMLAKDRALLLLPIGGFLVAVVAFVLGVKSWLYFLQKGAEKGTRWDAPDFTDT